MYSAQSRRRHASRGARLFLLFDSFFRWQRIFLLGFCLLQLGLVEAGDLFEIGLVRHVGSKSETKRQEVNATTQRDVHMHRQACDLPTPPTNIHNLYDFLLKNPMQNYTFGYLVLFCSSMNVFKKSVGMLSQWICFPNKT